jgi:hypothetical protein
MNSSTSQTVQYYVTFFEGQLSADEVLNVILHEPPTEVFPHLLSLVSEPEPPAIPFVPEPAIVPHPSSNCQTDRSADNRFSVNLHGFTREYAALYLRRVLMSWAIKNNYSCTFIHGKGIHAGGAAKLPMLTRNMCKVHGIEFEPGKNDGQTVAIANANPGEVTWLFASHVRWNLRNVLEKQEAPIRERSSQGRIWTTMGKKKERRKSKRRQKQIGESLPRLHAI